MSYNRTAITFFKDYDYPNHWIKMVIRGKHSVEFIYCGCNCGKTLSKYSKWGYERKFIQGHNLKLLDNKLDNHPNWKSGRRFNNGYIMIKRPEHHFADNAGYVREHRLIWEEYHKCCLMPYTVIHHKNHIKNDNRIENLEVNMSNSKHMITFHRIDTTDRVCNICNSNKTAMRITKDRDNYIHYYWYKDLNDSTKWTCNKCHLKQLRLLLKGVKFEL